MVPLLLLQLRLLVTFLHCTSSTSNSLLALQVLLIVTALVTHCQHWQMPPANTPDCYPAAY